MIRTGDPARARATLLFAHGWTGDKDEAFGYFQKLADILAAQNIATLRFDARGHGDSALPANIDFTLTGFVDDISACRAWLGQTYPTAPVVLVGYSLGGLAALLAAEAAPDDYYKLILLSPVLNGPDQLARFSDMTQLAELQAHTPTTLAAKATSYRNPLLLLQGTDDDDCLPDFAYEFMELTSADALYVEIPLLGHLCKADAHLQDITGEILAFL